MNWRNYKIGYLPYHPSCAVPGDRRRFVFYARERGLTYEIASAKKVYDVIYLTPSCNCSEWIAYKKAHPEVPLIFEIVDSYVLENLNFRNVFRGAARYLTGKEHQFYVDYRKALLQLISVADAVVCSTPIQRDFILSYNKNVHTSLDYFSDDISHHKQDFEQRGKLKLVWEGQAYTVQNILTINQALKELRDEVELHIITDPEIKMPFKIFDRKTTDVLKNLPCHFVMHPWEKGTFSQLIGESDLAIIPIPDNDRLMWNKPENKLLLLWEIGIPVFTSATPAYSRVMKRAGIDGICSSDKEWVEMVRGWRARNAGERKEMVDKARLYLQQNHSKNVILQNWDAIFASICTPETMMAC